MKRRKTGMTKNVAVLGASADPVKYSHRAILLLKRKGFNPIPVNPNEEEVDGMKCYPTLADVPDEVDTVTVYLRPSVSSQLIGDILAKQPRRVIENPGTDNEELTEACRAAGIEVVHACTLVLLNTGQF
jgi:predicted CoA-binding protein